MKQNQSSGSDQSSIFIQQNSSAIRIWHWLTFFIVTSLIITVLMASTVLNPRENVPVVQKILKDKGIVADNNQTFAITHMYDDKMWELHKYLGVILFFLFLGRIAIEFTQPDDERNQFRIKKAIYALLESKGDKKELKHYLAVKYSYIFFYMLLMVMVITGLIIAYGADWSLSGAFRHNVKEIHGFIQYFIYAFVLIHIAGVVRADIKKYKGMVSGMIHGNKYNS